jgi:hypothetical protein
MIFGNSSTAGFFDFAACKLRTQVDAMLDASNATATATPTSSSGSPPSLPTNGAATIIRQPRSPALRSCFFWQRL